MFYQAEILRASAKMEFFNGSRRQAQTVQAHRPEMQKNQAKLRIIRRTCCGIHLDQIRSHRLVFSVGPVTWGISDEKTRFGVFSGL
jgi:hypothetical protein